MSGAHAVTSIEPSLIRRQTFVAPLEEVELDSTHLPTIPPRRRD
ncbi:hypothetical protein [Microbacterium sp. Root180]|nr:hypothetical protein [Microbacterium sp. Root180]